MQVKIDVDQREIAQLVRRVRRWEQARVSEIRALIDATADAMVEDAKSRVPVKTGQLRDSIVKVLEDVAGRPAALVGATGRGRPYAHLVELGTHQSPAQPFLFPAFEAHIAGFRRDLIKILNRQ